MENEKKNTAKPQVFYFSEKGELVVESNKGIWVDGEQYVKMYGNFTCNAKTMGEIIHKLKGIKVEVGVEEKIIRTNEYAKDAWKIEDQHTIQHYCVLGAEKKRIDEYECELAHMHFETRKIAALKAQLEEEKEKTEEYAKKYREARSQIGTLEKSVELYNELPWWRRIFKKVEVK